ncbi:MAG: hypothetical protein COV44_00750 [Deltaproteobacteria bacterium CG11_big_fil_rev_8_21_14_0_20_45_16]|nr:MAG: hypothetical protein COV44_00750 [Deltaproteobacteria bacterium CG11_big_fil_rev_8_21_14_0_20_45_16]
MTKSPDEFGLSANSLSALRSLFIRYPKIDRVVLYGSRAKGNYRPGSDIDLTLIAPCLGLSELMKIQNEIDDMLLPYKVDLSLFHQLENADLKDHIERVGKDFLKH